MNKVGHEFYEELEKQPLTLYDVIRNLGYSVDMCDEIVDAVEEFEKSKEKEMIKRNLKTSLQELVITRLEDGDDIETIDAILPLFVLSQSYE
jgi:hypothetical protein